MKRTADAWLVVDELVTEVKQFREDYDSLKKETVALVTENNSLRQLLLQRSLDGAASSAGVLTLETNVQRHGGAAMSAENNNYLHMWEEAVGELNQVRALTKSKFEEHEMVLRENKLLQDDLKKARWLAEDLQSTCSRMKQDQDKFLQAAKEQDSETEKLKRDLRSAKVELNTAQLKGEELAKHVDMLQRQLKLKAEFSQQVVIDEATSEVVIRDLQTQLVDQQSKNVALQRDNQKLQVAKEELEEQVAVAKKRIQDLEVQEEESASQIKQSADLIDNALLEREQAMIQKRQKTDEIARLREQLSSISQESATKQRLEVDALRRQATSKILALEEELMQVEMESQRKQLVIEKLLKDKASVEKILEVTRSKKPTPLPSESLEKLRADLCKTELARLEAEKTLAKMEKAKEKMESRHAEILSEMEAEKAAQIKKYKMLLGEMEKVQSESVTLQDEVRQLKRDFTQCLSAKEICETQYQAEVARLKQGIQDLTEEGQRKVTTAETNLKSTIEELRRSLMSAQRHNDKLKNESKVLSRKLETRGIEMSQEVQNLKQRLDDISVQMAAKSKLCEDKELELVSFRQSWSRLQAVAAAAEEKVSDLQAQLFAHKESEKKLHLERRSLKKEIERLKFEFLNFHSARMMEASTNANLSRGSNVL